MGKKNKHLYSKIYSFENLYLASKKSRRGKRRKLEVIKFEDMLENQLFDIQSLLKNENYQFGDYRKFIVTEPKIRLIASAPYRDRIVHHALCNLIEPILDKAMIFDSYACRIGKGSHRAIIKAQSLLKKYKYCLKYDIKKYFFTIDHEILINDINKKITDKKIIQLIKNLLITYRTDYEYYFPMEGDNLFDKIRNRGLPIGNLTSQLFANFYLTSLDRYIKSDLKIKGYLRYMDDGVIFSNNKFELHEIKNKIIQFCNKKRLKLHQNKTQIFPVKNGLKYLGFHIYPNYCRILRPNLIRFKHNFKLRCKQYETGEIAWTNLLLSLNAWLGYVGVGKYTNIINQILLNIKFYHPDNRKGEYGFII